MTWLWDLNLIRFFDFYLALAFLLSTFVRIRQYRAALGLVFAVPERWPRLFQLVRQHQSILLTWGNLVPAAVALVLCVVHTLACRVVWPDATLTLGRLAHTGAAVPAVAMLGLAMLGVDVYGIWNVGELDRTELDRYFDQAEYWLRSWTAPVVRVVTFGYVNPRQMVAAEVQTALLSAGQLLNSTLWWVSVQTGLRIAYGLSIWLTFALTQG
ncbi:MAG: hypothetical protein L0Y54_15770 [Sporichthyaceae bacterium]|nr:hypothetical protein [Sporichthyaceae bacterium]